jgi:hypothetical protein
MGVASLCVPDRTFDDPEFSIGNPSKLKPTGRPRSLLQSRSVITTSEPCDDNNFLELLEVCKSMSGIRVVQAYKTSLLMLVISFLEIFGIVFLDLLTGHDLQYKQDIYRYYYCKSLASSSSDLVKDFDVFGSWRVLRGLIEEFQRITDRIEDYNESIGGQIVENSFQNDSVVELLKTHRTLLSNARFLEQEVRDTLQITAAREALIESSASIRQANTVGRISYLAAVFLPLSTVMSFYGMNIEEFLGTELSWRTFIISAVCVSLSTLIFCLFLVRRSLVGGSKIWFRYLAINIFLLTFMYPGYTIAIVMDFIFKQALRIAPGQRILRRTSFWFGLLRTSFRVTTEAFNNALKARGVHGGSLKKVLHALIS